MAVFITVTRALETEDICITLWKNIYLETDSEFVQENLFSGKIILFLCTLSIYNNEAYFI